METYRGEEEDCNASAILIKKQGFWVIITLEPIGEKMIITTHQRS
jgi:hypothetical protein